MTRPSGCNSFHNNSPNSSDNRNHPTCFRCGEQGHIRLECSKERVFCTHCRTPNHDTKACRKHHNSTPSPTNTHIPMGYHPTATPPLLLGATSVTGTHPQQTVTTTKRPLFQNYFDTHQPRTSNHHPHTLQRHITSTSSQHDRSTNINHNASHYQRQERRCQQADDE